MNDKKNRRKSLPIKDAFKVLNFLFAAILISACSREIVFPASQRLPDAEAVLRIDQLENQGYDIDLNVYNIPEARHTRTSDLLYVVWMVTRRDGTINIGSLRPEQDNRRSLTYQSAYEPIRIFVTEESNEEAVVPSSEIVLDSEEFDL